MPDNITLIFLPSRAPELNPVENIWQYMRANWLSNPVFDTCDAIIDASCEAWQKFLQRPQAITSIGMRRSTHVGQSSWLLVLVSFPHNWLMDVSTSVHVGHGRNVVYSG